MAASLASHLTLLAFAAQLASAEAKQPTYALSQATGGTAEDAADALGLLQRTKAAVRTKDPRPGMFPRDCFEEDHPEDLDRPIRLVREEYPDEDLFCRFLRYVPWFINYPMMHIYQSYKVSVEQAREAQAKLTLLPGLPEGQGRLVTFHTEATPPGGIATRLESPDLLDDIRCYTLGFLANQGLNGTLMNYYEEWKEIADRECEKIGQEYEFAEQELTVRHHKDLMATMNAGAKCAMGLGEPGCRPVTTRDIKLHAYQKCLLGDEAVEMSFCYSRACLMGSYIGHFMECQ